MVSRILSHAELETKLLRDEAPDDQPRPETEAGADDGSRTRMAALSARAAQTPGPVCGSAASAEEREGNE